MSLPPDILLSFGSHASQKPLFFLPIDGNIIVLEFFDSLSFTMLFDVLLKGLKILFVVLLLFTVRFMLLDKFFC